MDRVTGGIKGVSARAANAALGRTGQHFWEDESFDHWVRNERELKLSEPTLNEIPSPQAWWNGLRLALVQCGKKK